MKHLDSIDISPAWVDGVNWGQYNMDAASGLLFARQLEHIENMAYAAKMPALKAREVFGVNNNFDQGAETTTYYATDVSGDFELITDYRKDFHAFNTEGEKNTSNFESFGRLITYSIQDIRAAEMAGIALQQIQPNAARRMWEQRVESVALSGYGDSNLKGMFNTAGIPQSTAASNMMAMSGQALYTLLADTISAMSDSTGGEQMANAVYVTQALMTKICTTQVSTNYRMNVKQAIEQDFDVRVESWVGLKAAAGDKEAIVALNQNADNFEIAISREFELGTPQPEQMAFSLYAHGRMAGLIVRYTRSISIVVNA